MNYVSDKHHRRSIRLKEYDYSLAGAYFVTVCAWNRACLFGDIVEGMVELSEFGKIVHREWRRSSEIRQEIELDSFTVMPNHVHGIVIINRNGSRVGANGRSPMTEQSEQPNAGRPAAKHKAGRSAESPLRMESKSVSSFIAGFKSAVTKSINTVQNTPGMLVWQRNYYEHVIRDENDLNRIRQYIVDNPVKWDIDENNPANVKPEAEAIQ